MEAARTAHAARTGKATENALNPLAVASVLSGPAEFAAHHSNGRWQALRHLRLISDTIADIVLARQTRIIIIEAPPRHGKSELVSHWLQAWFLSLFPELNCILASYEADFAAHWGRLVRNTLAEIGTVQLAPDSQAAHRWHTAQGGGLQTAGIDGATTGKSANGLFTVDDPIKNAQEADSETMREKLWNWWQTVPWTRREPGTTFVVMATRWHEDDLIGRILAHPEMSKLVVRVHLPALADDGDQLGRAYGEALWPEKFPADDLLITKRSMDPRWWEALFMQRPSAQEGAEIKRNWWGWYDELPVRPEQMDQIIVSWDCAFRDTATSDFVVGQCWGIYGAYRYLLDQIRDRMDFTTTVTAVKAFNARWQPTVTLIEAKANGDAVINSVRDVVPALIPINPRESKIARARAIAPQVQAGQVFLPRGKTFSDDLVEECAAFPLGKHDDQVDALSQALEWARAMRSIPRHDFVKSDDRFIPPRVEKERHRLQALIPQYKF